MRILYIVPYTPTPIRTRPYNLIRALARRGHQVTAAALWEDAAERAALADLHSQGIEIIAHPLSRLRSLWNCLRGLPTSTPLQAVYCWQPALARAVEEGIRGQGSGARDPEAGVSRGPFDVIHVEHLRGARYGLHLKSRITDHRSQIPIVWDSVDCISYLFEQAARDSRTLQGRLMTRLELGRTRRYEGWLARRFDRVLVTSAVDRAALEGLAALHSSPSPLRRGGKGGEVVVLPNGVDLAYFTPDETPRAAATVLFSGKMSYHANVTAALHLAHDIMPLVWARRPDVQVWIVGKDPPQNVQRLNVQRSTFQRSTFQRSNVQRSNVPTFQRSMHHRHRRRARPAPLPATGHDRRRARALRRGDSEQSARGHGVRHAGRRQPTGGGRAPGDPWGAPPRRRRRPGLRPLPAVPA